MSAQQRYGSVRNVLFNALVGLLLLSFSIIAALAVGEVLLRSFSPSPTPGDYEQRFLIDGQPSFEPGYFTSDPILPFALKPNYKHTVVDLGWYPKPFTVSIDARGYRNTPSDNQPASVVFVGDSFIFGFGVEDDETIPAQLGMLMHQKVYNLGIPGTGPESYMIMLERYLNASPPPRLIIIGFFTGNDFNDLEHATWKELDNCEPPASKIYRSDVPVMAPVYPVWVTSSFLKSSHLANFLVGFTASRKPMEPWELAQMHQLSSEIVIATLKLIKSSPKDLENSINTSLAYANELERMNLSKPERDLLESYKIKMNEKDWRWAYPIAAEIGKSLTNRDYNPVSKKQFINIVPYFNFYSGYYWRIMDENASGYILDYDHLLDVLKNNPAFQEFASNFTAVQVKLRARDTSVEADINKINTQLKRQFGNPYTSPAGCDKFDLFLKRTQTLADTHGSNLLIVSIPAEYQLKDFIENKISDYDGLCDRASKYKIACFSLAPNFMKHYEENDTALYLDGSHANRQGSMLVAQWINEWIREHQQQ